MRTGERLMLTDVDCKNASCARELKRRRLFDSFGLYLEISPTGSKRWFWKFYPDGKESRLALGSYPDVSLKEARLARDEARKIRHSGANPVQQRKIARMAKAASNAATFEGIARELYAVKSAPGGWSHVHAAQWMRGLEKDVFPWLGSLPISEISAPVLLGTLRRVEKRGAVRSAHDLREFAGQVFRYGIQTGRCIGNPASDLRGALRQYNEKHLAAVLEPAPAGDLLRAIEDYQGHPVTRAALKLSRGTFARWSGLRSIFKQACGRFRQRR
jgi:hypothetical protein